MWSQRERNLIPSSALYLEPRRKKNRFLVQLYTWSQHKRESSFLVQPYDWSQQERNQVLHAALYLELAREKPDFCFSFYFEPVGEKPNSLFNFILGVSRKETRFLVQLYTWELVCKKPNKGTKETKIFFLMHEYFKVPIRIYQLTSYQCILDQSLAISCFINIWGTIKSSSYKKKNQIRKLLVFRQLRWCTALTKFCGLNQLQVKVKIIFVKTYQ